MSQEQKYKAVAEVLARLQPAMEVDGGGIAHFTVTNDVVGVAFMGTCLFCPSRNLTLSLGVKKTLRQALPWVAEVVALN